MKKIWTSALCCALLLSLAGCREIPPIVSPIMDQGECPAAAASVVANQQRNVLIEEFTGVRCVNCPAGAQAIEALLNQHGDRLVAVSIHAGFFSPPYPESLYDFRTPAGNQILSLLGEPLGYPTASVNRKKFPGQFGINSGQSTWPGNVQQEKEVPPKVKLAINRNFNAATRELTVDVTVFIEETLTNSDVRLSVMLTEDNVTDYQLTPAGKEADYLHKHILRTVLTNADGNTLQENLEAGNRFCKRYITTVPAEWKAADSKIVAFVSLGGTTKDVLQVVQVKMVP
jgi:hypothetical protein